MTRVWADTNYGGHPAPTRASTSSRRRRWSSARRRELKVEGYIGDPATLDRARREEVCHMSLGQRVARWLGNVPLLFVHNALWPDSTNVDGGWREAWLDASKAVLLAVLCPLALLGMASCLRRPSRRARRLHGARPDDARRGGVLLRGGEVPGALRHVPDGARAVGSDVGCEVAPARAANSGPRSRERLNRRGRRGRREREKREGEEREGEERFEQEDGKAGSSEC